MTIDGIIDLTDERSVSEARRRIAAGVSKPFRDDVALFCGELLENIRRYNNGAPSQRPYVFASDYGVVIIHGSINPDSGSELRNRTPEQIIDDYETTRPTLGVGLKLVTGIGAIIIDGAAWLGFSRNGHAAGNGRKGR